MEAARQVLADCGFLLGHEMRSPLMVLEGFGQQLQARHAGALGPDGEHYVARMRQAGDRMTAQTQAMLRLLQAACQPLRRERIELSGLAAATLAALRQKEPDRDVEVKVDTGLACDADAALLAPALDALLENAWKFTGGRARAHIHFGRIAPAATEPEPVYFVADDGAGFDAGNASRLFSAFSRCHAENEYPGVGVGLALARLAVGRHGGRIWAESTPGQGTRICFTIGAA